MTEQKMKAAAEPPLDCRVGRCDPHCDYENAKLVSRATWVCPDCGRDYSIEYLFWAQASHPEWFAAKCDHKNRECTYESDDGEFERWQCNDCGERWGVEVPQ